MSHTDRQIAEYIARRVSLFQPSAEKSHFVLGLPTGSSPLPVYQRLVELYKKGDVSFKVCHIPALSLECS
jgi:glucosamine-6-phosphate deaminase